MNEDTAPPKPALDAMRKALVDLTGAMRFVLAFYEPGQRYLDTNAWKNAEAEARTAFAKAEITLSAPVPPAGKVVDLFRQAAKLTPREQWYLAETIANCIGQTLVDDPEPDIDATPPVRGDQ